MLEFPAHGHTRISSIDAALLPGAGAGGAGVSRRRRYRLQHSAFGDQRGAGREIRHRGRDDPAIIEQELLKGAEKAREVSVPYLAEIRYAIGIRKLG